MPVIFDIEIENCDGVPNSIEDWIPPSCTLRFGGLPVDRPVDLELILISGVDKLYDYFPFLIEATVSPENIEIFEIDAAEQQYACWLHDVVADQHGQASVRLRSELSGTPSKLGLNSDERALVALLSLVTVYPGSEVAAIRLPPRIVRSIASSAHLDVCEHGPVFVVGCYRSGTSILTWALGQHPDLLPMEETNWLRCTLLGALAGYREASGATRSGPEIYDINQAQFLQWIGNGLNQMHHSVGRDLALRSFLQRLCGKTEEYNSRFQVIRSRWNLKRRWVDGTPENTGIAPLLAQAFPSSKFIAMVRNPLQVVASLMHFNRIGGQAHTLDEAVRQWLQMTELAMRTSEYLGKDRVQIVFYEDLIQNPVTVMRELFAFLGLPNFSQSAKTFAVRINSSSIDQKDLNDLSSDHIDAAEKIFQQLRAGMPASLIDWGPDSLGILDEVINDMAERIIASLS